MDNNTTTAGKLQGRNFEIGANYHKLEMISINALVTLSQAVFELADNPVHMLTRLYELLNGFYKQNREKDCVDLLYLVFGMLGIEYAGVMTQLRGYAEARRNFLYGFIANIGELIEELEQRNIST